MGWAKNWDRDESTIQEEIRIRRKSWMAKTGSALVVGASRVSSGLVVLVVLVEIVPRQDEDEAKRGKTRQNEARQNSSSRASAKPPQPGGRDDDYFALGEAPLLDCPRHTPTRQEHSGQLEQFRAARPARQQMANGPRFLVGTPSKTVPLTCPARYLVFGILYHRDPRRVVQGDHTLHSTQARALRRFAEPKPCPLWDDRASICWENDCTESTEGSGKNNIGRLI